MSTALQHMLDRAALRQTAELYAQGADRRDKALWQQVLAPEIVIEGPGFRAEGLDANLGSLDALGQMFRGTQHRVSNQLVTIDGDRAMGETYCVAEHLLLDADAVLVWSLRYQDAWRRVGDTWRFTQRILKVDWQETRPVTMMES